MVWIGGVFHPYIVTVYCIKGFTLGAGPGDASTKGTVLKRPASKGPDQVDATEPKEPTEPTPTPAEAAEPKASEKVPKAAKAKSAKAKAKSKTGKGTEEKIYEPNWYKAGNRWGIKVGKREACSVPRLP